MQLLKRAFQILRVIAEAQDDIGVVDIARRAGLPKSTTSRILAGLVAQEAVARSAENHFTIGTTITYLNAKRPFLHTLTTLAEPILQTLVDETQEAAAVCVRDGHLVNYVLQVQSGQAVQVLDWTGQSYPLHVLAAGKLFLAFGSADFTRTYLARPLVKYTDKTLTASTLSQELDQIRQRGFAETDEEFANDLVGYAAPIFDNAGECIAAVNVFGPKFRFVWSDDPSRSAEKRLEIIQKMLAAATQLQQTIPDIAL